MKAKQTKKVSIQIEGNTLRKLQSATTALSELASASITSTDLPTGTKSRTR